MSNVFKITKRRIFVLLGILTLLTLSGCGVEYKTDSDGNIVTSETGERTVTNQITDEDTFIQTFKDDGWFSGLLVYPLVKLITIIGEGINSYGLALILTTFLVRGIAMPLTLKSSKSQKKMKEVEPKVQKVRLKYAGKKDRDSQMRMNAEVQKIYKDNNISMFGGCLGMLVTMPLFFAFYSAIYRTPGLFEQPFLGIQLAYTPKFQIIDQGNFAYVIPIIIVFALNFLSMKYTMNSSKPQKADVKRPYNAAKEDSPSMMGQQMKMMQYIMPVMMAFITFTLPVGIGLYFIASSGVSMFQTFLIKRL